LLSLLQCYFGHLDVVNTLIDCGANRKHKDELWNTPEMLASKNNHYQALHCTALRSERYSLRRERSPLLTPFGTIHPPPRRS
jgi:ankyrin repeat protein